jgi:hypothetical protein
VWAIDSILSTFRSGDFDALVRAGREATGLSHDAALDNGRIAMRRGRDHEIYQRHQDVMEVFIALNRHLEETLPRGLDKFLTFRREPLAKRLEAHLDEGETRFLEARAAFIDGAATVVGAEL